MEGLPAQPSPVPVVDAAGFRQVVGRFATGVTVVSTAVAGMRYGMTVNSFTSVSLDPLLVLFCCEHDASIHAPLLHGGHWSVSVLRADQVELSRRFAKSFPADVDAWTGVDSVAGAVDGDPLVPFALATMQCRTVATYAGGDHTILLGEAVTCELGEPGDPLLYYASRYRTVAAPDVG